MPPYLSLTRSLNFWDHPRLFAGLKRKHQPIRWRQATSLLPLLAPPVGFALVLLLAHRFHPRFDWLAHPSRYPWEIWIIAGCGFLATLSGMCDWLFHRIFHSVGPLEHRSHLLALGTGGLPLFLCMVMASISGQPRVWLLPVLLLALYTTVLICYDEFVFHRSRCKWLETLFHRCLVFGNGLAWLAWMHWCFVRTGG